MQAPPEGKDELLLRDGKSLPGAQCCPTLIFFLLNMFIVLPLCLFVLLPLALVYFLISYPFTLCCSKSSEKAPLYVFSQKPDAKDIIPKAERQFDVILFGATGFTGGLAAKYMARMYGSQKVKWALAGRSLSSLETVRQELLAIDGSLRNLPLLIADSSKPDTLRPLVSCTRVILSTVGPFVRYGTPLVELCALYGTDYCDITGETDWVRSTIDRFDDIAHSTGSRIVHFTGHDCVPWDLATYKVAKSLKAKGESLVEIKAWDEIKGSASGGTLETVFESVNNRQKLNTSLKFDPLMKFRAGDGSAAVASDSKTVSNNQSFLGYRKDALQGKGRWTGWFVMSMVMANCIKRSNALNKYSGSGTLKYYEALVHANFMAGFNDLISMLFLGISFVFPPLQWALRTCVLPKPGQGPSIQEMDAGFLRVTVEGKGDRGSQVTAVIYFPTDPGYIDTARMMCESGLCLALESDKCTKAGGIYTPASGIGEVLLDRLVATGSSFQLIE